MKLLYLGKHDNFGVTFIVLEKGQTWGVNLGVSHLEMRNGTDRIKFHRSKYRLKREEAGDRSLRNTHPWEQKISSAEQTGGTEGQRRHEHQREL